MLARILWVFFMTGCISGKQPSTEAGRERDAGMADGQTAMDAGAPQDANIELDRGFRAPIPDAAVPPPQHACDSPLTGQGPWEINLGDEAARHQGSCGGIGREAVIEFQAPETGYWLFSTSNEFTSDTDTVIYIRTECEQASSERGCDDDSGEEWTTSQLSIELTEGETIYVFVDAWDGEGGAARLVATKIRTRALGDTCGPGQPCESPLICFGDEDGGVCAEVRERMAGEPCDPRGETGLCEAGLECLRTTSRREGICTAPQIVGEGEPCDLESGILRCAEGFACARIAMEGAFCLPIELQPEGAICDPSDVTRPCPDGLLCYSADMAAPRCNAAASECPADWPVVQLNEEQAFTAMGQVEMNGILTEVCNRGRPAPAAVFGFTAPETGDWIFETGPAADDQNLDTIMELRSHCGFGPPNHILCNDDGGPSWYSRAHWSGTADETVYIVVTGFGGERGPFTLRAIRREQSP